MARSTRIITAFLAHAGDTADERKIAVEVVEDINRAQGRRDGFQIELLRYEEDAFPGGGADAQDVINRQIGDYDILIGILSSRFGTPTGRAASGTEEEFDRAYRRHLENPSAIKIAFYFRNKPMRLLEIDAYQLLLVQRFRERVHRLGFLVWDISELDEFRRRLSTHLQRLVHGLVEGIGATPATLPPTKAAPTEFTLKNWHGLTNKVYPQWACYRELPLEKFPRYSSLTIKGIFRSPSPYFRFGFKLLTRNGRLFGDGSIQSQDNNLVVHIGKNKEDQYLFRTFYFNGVRHEKNHIFSEYVKDKDLVIEFQVRSDNSCHLLVDDELIYETHISPPIRDKCILLGWGDQEEYEFFFKNIRIIIQE